METSAKTGFNIDQMFMTIAEDFVSHNKNSSRGELSNVKCRVYVSACVQRFQDPH